MTHLNMVLNSHAHFNMHDIHIIGRHCDGMVMKGTKKLCGESARHVKADQIIEKLLDDIGAALTTGPPPEHMSN